MSASIMPQPIPLNPISDFSSLEATVTLQVDGSINGRPARGGLNGLLVVDGPRSRITISGSLLGEIAAQVGGSLIGLFTPASVDLFKMPDGPYVSINGFMPICVKPQSVKATAVLDEMSPESLMAMLTSPDVARGSYAGEGTLNGRSVKHYIIDGPTFLAAARASRDPQLRAFGEGLRTAGDNDLYVDSQGGYPVAFRGDYSGTYAPLKFQGDFEVQLALTSVGAGQKVSLPPACADPISM